MIGKTFDQRLLACVTAMLLSFSPPIIASGDHGDHDGGHGYSFGKPASAGEADRTVTVTAKDTMTFSPSTIEVREGETIRFVVKNVGKLQHSFTLGTPSDQRMHEDEMKEMPMDMMAGHMDDEPNGVVVPPGETRSLTWRFSGSSSVQFACHIPGHYPAGMTGAIEIR